jgi:hypothetical protein
VDLVEASVVREGSSRQDERSAKVFCQPASAPLARAQHVCIEVSGGAGHVYRTDLRRESVWVERLVVCGHF